FYAPRTRGAGEQRGAASWSWGSGKSASRFRLYFKVEAGAQFARTECNLRRDALRRYGINTVADLRATNWSRLATRLFRFVEVRAPKRGHAGLDNEVLQTKIDAVGVRGALDAFPSRRASLRRRLRPSGNHLALVRQLLELEDRLALRCP